MHRIARVISVIVLASAIIWPQLHCIAQETADEGAAGLIKQAKAYIQVDREKAISALDAAFQSANSIGDCDALMEIGDLYIKVDPSLKDKAMEAWAAAGGWKCR